jgi:hypothetical protein
VARRGLSCFGCAGAGDKAMVKATSAILGVAVLFMAGCGSNPYQKIPQNVRTALEKADQFELLSLDPASLDPSRPAIKPENSFHRWEILGKTEVNDIETRKKLVAALQKGIGDHPNNYVVNCFNPRHGIRVTSEGKTVDLVICFECENIYIHAGNDSDEKCYQTTNSPQPVFDEVLRQAGVPLPKPAKK